MVQYVFKDGPIPVKDAKYADPQVLGEAYEAAGRDDEVLHDAAKNRRHPWHRHLEWDDSIAGRKYRLQQIGHIIRLIAVVNDEQEEIPAFISLKTHGIERARYSPQEIIRNADLQVAALRAADRDLEAFQRRHRVLCDLCDDVQGMREKIREKIDAAVGDRASAA